MCVTKYTNKSRRIQSQNHYVYRTTIILTVHVIKNYEYENMTKLIETILYFCIKKKKLMG